MVFFLVLEIDVSSNLCVKVDRMQKIQRVNAQDPIPGSSKPTSGVLKAFSVRLVTLVLITLNF